MFLICGSYKSDVKSPTKNKISITKACSLINPILNDFQGGYLLSERIFEFLSFFFFPGCPTVLCFASWTFSWAIKGNTVVQWENVMLNCFHLKAT